MGMLRRAGRLYLTMRQYWKRGPFQCRRMSGIGHQGCWRRLPFVIVLMALLVAVGQLTVDLLDLIITLLG